MNYSNIINTNKRQFDSTMKREKITVTDYFDSTKTYDVFFRKNNRGTNPQGKIRLFYAQNTPIAIGTIFVLKDIPYLVISKDGIESDVYYTSLAVKCDTTFNVYSNSEGRYVTVPCAVISDKYTLTHNSTISMISGSVAMYHYCEIHSDDEDNDLMMNVKADIIHKMMKLNENFKNTEMYKALAKRILEDIRSDIKCGRILVTGTYATVLGNPIEMLEEAIGQYKPETTVIGKGNIISTAFDEKQLLACRSPHICAGNIYLPNNHKDVELSNGKHLTDYINLTENIVVINSVGENTLQRMNSMDMDSDQIMIVDNDIMLDAAKKNYDKFLVPTTDIEPVTKVDEYTSKNLSELDYKTSENLIGEIVNLSQVLNSKLWNEMNKDKPNKRFIQKLYKDICQLSIMSGLEIDKAKKTLIVDNKTEVNKIRDKYKSNIDGKSKIEYPEFFRELSRKGRYNSNKTYRYYNTTLDMIGKKIAYKQLVVKNDGKALESILIKPDIKSRDVDDDKIKAIIEICEHRASEDAKLSEVKRTQGKSQYIKQRQLAIENFIDEIEEHKKMNQPTLYTLLTSEDTQDYIDYILQGLLEVKCTTLNKLVRISEKTPTLIEDKNGNIDIYGIAHKHNDKEVA